MIEAGWSHCSHQLGSAQHSFMIDTFVKHVNFTNNQPITRQCWKTERTACCALFVSFFIRNSGSMLSAKTTRRESYITRSPHTSAACPRNKTRRSLHIQNNINSTNTARKTNLLPLLPPQMLSDGPPKLTAARRSHSRRVAARAAPLGSR
jgi:hypothetical protein